MKSFFWACLLVLGGLCCVSSVFLWSQRAKPAEVLADTATPFNPSVWAWRNEEHWAVDQVTKDIVEMALFAVQGDPSKAKVETIPVGARVYRVVISGPLFEKPFETRVELKEFLWNPETFTPLVKDLVRLLNIKPVRGASAGNLKTLLSPTGSEIERAQAGVSRALNANPASANVHEEAALVLGVFGLFDQAGAFQDHRAILCRMTSHLALAAGLRTGDLTAEGKLAKVGLLILVGRQAQAVGEIEGYRKDPSIPTACVNVLFMLSTSDWRLVDHPAMVSLAEALAAFKGRSYHQGGDRGADWILSSGRTDLPLGYVARITVLGNKYSVSTAGRLVPPSLDCDIADLLAVNTLRNGEALSSDQKVCAALSAHPGRGWNPANRHLEVIGWGIWAQHFQALLLDDMMRTINYHHGMLGSKPATLKYLDVLERRFCGLEQFPVLQKRYADIRPEVYREAILKAAYFAQKHPELLSDCSWTSLNHAVGDNPLPKVLPRYQDWLSLVMPFGTTYNWNYRIWEIVEKEKMTAAETAGFLEMNPFNLSIMGYYLYVRFPEQHYTPEAVETACAATKAFNRLNYLERLASAYSDHSQEKLTIRQELAGLDNKWLFNVAKELVYQKRESEASEVYLKAFREVENRIMVSNGAAWEVLYLYRTGKTEAAEEIAQECADIYSYRGLQTLALLREAQGRLPEAEQEYAKIAKRYSDEYILPAFHYRNRLKSKEYQMAWDQACGRLFPKGLQKLEGAQAGLPASGLVLQDDSAYLRHRGIARNAVIVGVDGCKVDDLKQFSLVRTFDWRDQMILQVFQRGRYESIALDGRDLGVHLVPYKASGGAK